MFIVGASPYARRMAKKRDDEAEEVGTERARVRESRHFLLDTGYAEGEEFCKALLNTGDFGQGFMSRLVPRGMKSLPKGQLVSELAVDLTTGAGVVDPDQFLLEYCKQPRSWLCIRRGELRGDWEQKHTAHDFLTRKQKTTDIVWFGPFGDDPDERWYVATKNVWSHVFEEGAPATRYPIRWHVIAQVNRSFVALHWNNLANRSEDPAQPFRAYPYWRTIPEIFDDLSAEIGGTWKVRTPNLSEVILHGAFDRYGQSEEYTWQHKRVRASYNTVALNAHGSGGTGKGKNAEERAASGLTILTTALAATAVGALDLGADAKTATTRVERALLRQILREWGTKSYEFILQSQGEVDAEIDDGVAVGTVGMTKAIARMHIYFGTEGAHYSETSTIDSLQHIHCFQKEGFGGSTKALQFILSEAEGMAPEVADRESSPTMISDDDGRDYDYDQEDYFDEDYDSPFDN